MDFFPDVPPPGNGDEPEELQPAWAGPPPPPEPPHYDDERFPSWEPDRPVLIGEGGGGGPRSVDRDYWPWPLPPAGPLRVACQWLEQGIEMSIQELHTQPFLEAAARAQPAWPPT